MQQDEAARRNFGQPVIQIVPNIGFGMQTIQMQNIDLAIAELSERLVKRLAQQVREELVVGAIVGPDLLESCFIIKPGVRVSFPSVDSKTTCVRLIFDDRLTEGEITLASIGSELDENARAFLSREIVGEENVFRPSAHAIDARLKALGREFHLHACRRRTASICRAE
jgi:hypothetical protein